MREILVLQEGIFIRLRFSTTLEQTEEWCIFIYSNRLIIIIYENTRRVF
jgi:hypothetical protein